MAQVTLYDCILRIPQLIKEIVTHYEGQIKEKLFPLKEELNQINEIILIGSGTSDTAAHTAKYFMEKVTKMKVSNSCPNEFLQNHSFYNEKALYIFISQTGHSKITREALNFVLQKGYLSLTLTESPTTMLAKDGQTHILMGCGPEEFPMRTIGYTTSVTTLMLIGLSIGEIRGTVTLEERRTYLEQLASTIDQQVELPEKTMFWLDNHRRKLMSSSCILFVGSGKLLGVAKEAAMKIWEIPQVASIAYEIEESLHGPNYGYNSNHCVVVLNDGSCNQEKMLALASYVKATYRNGFVLGQQVVDDQDYQFEVTDNDFKFLRFSMVLQILAYRLALDGGRDLISPHDNSIMNSYFTTHEEIMV